MPLFSALRNPVRFCVHVASFSVHKGGAEQVAVTVVQLYSTSILVRIQQLHATTGSRREETGILSDAASYHSACILHDGVNPPSRPTG